jgi:hypothetical protein
VPDGRRCTKRAQLVIQVTVNARIKDRKQQKNVFLFHPLIYFQFGGFRSLPVASFLAHFARQTDQSNRHSSLSLSLSLSLSFSRFLASIVQETISPQKKIEQIFVFIFRLLSPKSSSSSYSFISLVQSKFSVN